jgi:hypothetical protein
VTYGEILVINSAAAGSPPERDSPLRAAPLLPGPPPPDHPDPVLVRRATNIQAGRPVTRLALAHGGSTGSPAAAIRDRLGS